MIEHLRALQKVMKLNDWNITLHIGLCSTRGHNYIVYNDYMAEITIDQDLSEKEQLRTLIHEMIHICLRNTQVMTSDNVENEKVKEIIDREMERETERLANTIFDLYLGGS